MTDFTLFGGQVPAAAPNGVMTQGIGYPLREVDQTVGAPSEGTLVMRYVTGGYAQGETYQGGSVVRDGRWTMISNKETGEYAFPIPIGEPDWAVFPGLDPTWEEPSTSTARLLTGIKIIPTENGFVGGVRVWIPLVDADTAYYFLLVPETGLAQYILLSPTTTGWFPITFAPSLLPAGAVVEAYLVTQGQGTSSTTFTRNWTYRLSAAGVNPDNPPSLGQFRHFNVNAPDTAYLNKTDADGFSRKGELDTLRAGDTIGWTDSGGVDVFFTLTADPVYYNSPVSGDEDFYELKISPAVGQGSNGTAAMTFTHFLDRPTAYVRIEDEFLGNPNVRGLISANGTVEDVVENDTAYGIDVFYQEYNAPADWDVLAFTPPT